MKIDEIDECYFAATHKWPVHYKKDIAEVMTKMYMKKNFGDKLNDHDIYKIVRFCQKMSNIGGKQQTYKKEGLMFNDNCESGKKYTAGIAAGCSHEKSGRVEWCYTNEGEELARICYKKYEGSI